MRSRYPELAEETLAWSGSFGTQKGGGGVSDLMHFDIMRRRGGVRASHYPQIQDLGALPIEHAVRAVPLAKRTLSDYLGHHPATIGRQQQSLTIDDHTGGMVHIASSQIGNVKEDPDDDVWRHMPRIEQMHKHGTGLEPRSSGPAHYLQTYYNSQLASADAGDVKERG